MFADAFLGRVVRVSAGEYLGQEQEDEASDETRDRQFSRELHSLGEEIHERQGEQDPSRKSSRVRPAPCAHLPAEQGQQACSRKAYGGQRGQENSTHRRNLPHVATISSGEFVVPTCSRCIIRRTRACGSRYAPACPRFNREHPPSTCEKLQRLLRVVRKIMGLARVVPFTGRPRVAQEQYQAGAEGQEAADEQVAADGAPDQEGRVYAQALDEEASD
jgi:hypothetical protein